MLKIALESLGCSKNLVDAEIMMGILNRKGYKLVGDFEEADIILVMNNGNVIETGTHEELLEKQGFYANLYNSQFVKY